MFVEFTAENISHTRRHGRMQARVTGALHTHIHMHICLFTRLLRNNFPKSYNMHVRVHASTNHPSLQTSINPMIHPASEPTIVSEREICRFVNWETRTRGSCTSISEEGWGWEGGRGKGWRLWEGQGLGRGPLRHTVNWPTAWAWFPSHLFSEYSWRSQSLHPANQVAVGSGLCSTSRLPPGEKVCKWPRPPLGWLCPSFMIGYQPEVTTNAMNYFYQWLF